MSNTADVTASYRLAARTTRREAGNFYVALLTLPRAERRAVYALYAFFRELDDAADRLCPHGEGGQHPGNRAGGAIPCRRPDCVQVRRDAMREIRRRLAGVVAGNVVCERDLALADAIERFAIEPGDIEDVVRGVEADLEPVEMETVEDLERYAYLVASAVGLATLAILNGGVPPTDEMRERAVRLGLGMQLANVVRDVGEDAAQGRIYVPRDLLGKHGASAESIRAGTITPELRLALAGLGVRARDHLRAGRELMHYVPRHSRACLWLLSEVYGRILTRIEEAGYDVFPARISLSMHEKLWLLATARCRI